MRTAAVLALACLGAGCDDGPGARPEATGDPGAGAAPTAERAAEVPGTVLRVDDLSVTAGEVDRIAEWIERLYPSHTRAHARRVALAELVLPRAGARAAHPEARERAREACAAARRALVDGAPPREPEIARGDWRELGFVLWSLADAQAPGAWSEPFEDVGRFVLVRRDGILDEGVEPPEARTLALSILAFPYLEDETTVADLDRMIDATRLSVLDPEWERLVPEHWKYRMRGEER